MTGEPLPQCQFRVEPAYERVGPAHECVNPCFFDAGDGPDPAFDLRDALAYSAWLTPWRRLPAAPRGAARFGRSGPRCGPGPCPRGPGSRSGPAGRRSAAPRGTTRRPCGRARPCRGWRGGRRLAPSGTLESLTWMQRSRPSPTLASNSSTTSASASGGADLEPRGQQVAAVEAGAEALAASGGVDQLGELVRSSGPAAPGCRPCSRAGSGSARCLPSASRITLPARFTEGA